MNIPNCKTYFEGYKIDKKSTEFNKNNYFLRQYLQNPTVSKQMKRDISNLNNYIYLLHKQSDRVKMRIEKDNTYSKSAKNTENLGFYDTYLCSTNKVVLNTQAFNKTQGDYNTNKHKHYETRNQCSRYHDHSYDTTKDLTSDSYVDNTYCNNYLKHKGHNNLVKSKRKSLEKTEDNKMNVEDINLNTYWDMSRKLENPKLFPHLNSLKNINKINEHIYQTSKAFKNNSISSNEIRNTNDVISNYQELNKEITNEAENILETQTHYLISIDGFSKQKHNRDLSSFLNAYRRKTKIDERIIFPEKDGVECSENNNNDGIQHFNKQTSNIDNNPNNFNLLNELVYIRKIQRAWRSYKIIKYCIIIQKTYRNYKSRCLIQDIKNISKGLFNFINTDISKISNLLSNYDGLNKFILSKGLNRTNNQAYHKCIKIIFNVIKIQKTLRKFIKYKQFLKMYSLNEKVIKLQKSWRRYKQTKNEVSKNRKENLNEEKTHITNKQNLVDEIIDNDLDLVNQDSSFKNENKIIKIHIDLNERRSNYEKNRRITTNKELITQTTIKTKESGEINENEAHMSLINPSLQIQKTILNDRIQNKVMDCSEEFSNNQSVQIDEGSYHKLRNYEKHIYIGLNKVKNHRDAQSKNSKINTNNQTNENLNDTFHCTVNNSKIIEKDALNPSLYAEGNPNVQSLTEDKIFNENKKENSNFSKSISIRNQETNEFFNYPYSLNLEDQMNIQTISTKAFHTNVLDLKKEQSIKYNELSKMPSCLIDQISDWKLKDNKFINITPEPINKTDLYMIRIKRTNNLSFFTKNTKSNYHLKKVKILQKMFYSRLRNNFKYSVKIQDSFKNNFSRKCRFEFPNQAYTTNNYLTHNLQTEEKSEENCNFYNYKYQIFEYKIINVKRTNTKEQIIKLPLPHKIFNEEKRSKDSPLINKKYKDIELVDEKNDEFVLQKKEEFIQTNEYDKMKFKYRSLMTKLKRYFVDNNISIEILGKNFN